MTALRSQPSSFICWGLIQYIAIVYNSVLVKVVGSECTYYNGLCSGALVAVVGTQQNDDLCAGDTVDDSFAFF